MPYRFSDTRREMGYVKPALPPFLRKGAGGRIIVIRAVPPPFGGMFPFGVGCWCWLSVGRYRLEGGQYIPYAA